ncbi:poly(R)-hydroxyalkanoic acid synthase subunit PhaE [Pseudoxanthomonas sp. USHLN014]|uniref:poly(R)-hydroxyalkanoic acid synthase subunit PhaE n=1 Tax=Pseudoxanthomonas sp. USHLN014 TaxID=3081297 RepID=UPI00301E0458
MARQVWETWGEALRKFASVPLETAAPAWQQVPGGWPGWTPPKGGAPGDVMERFDGLARHWFGRMQHVAAQFADRDNTPADIVAAWRQALGATEANPYPDLFGSLFGQATGLDDLGEQWLPWLESLRGPLEEWSRTPAFGPAREHQQRWKGLLQAQHALREAAEAYRTLLEDASRQAYAMFEEKLNQRAGEGSALDSARALFDEWIDAAEDAYARMALSEEFSEVYGALANAQMRMRAGVQREVEQLGSLLGLPTRTEVDAAHRKIAELERILRRMMRGQAAERPAAAPETPRQAPSPARPVKAAKKTAASKPSAASKAPTKKSAKTAAKKIGEKPTAKKAAAKKATAKKAGRTNAPTEPVSKTSARRTTRGKAPA